MRTYSFRGKRFCFTFPSDTLVMGVLNLTPDSFSDGGLHADDDDAVRAAEAMQAAGAAVIDVGAMSTAPGRAAVTPAQEIARLSPVLPRLTKTLKTPVSVDTLYPETARFALENGAAIINDVGGVFNPETAAAVREYGAGWILAHGGSSEAEGLPGRDVVRAVKDFFSGVLNEAKRFGIDPQSVCLDPGIGFGKSRAEDALLLRRLSEVRLPGTALLVGASRKRLIGEASGETEPPRRDFGTVAAHTAAVAGGVDIIRAHNVRAAVQGARVADALYRRAASPVEEEKSTGKILIDGLKIFAYHGVNPEEKRDGQTFILDIEISCDLSVPRLTDRVGDTVSYARVAKSAARLFTAQKYDLIERAAQAVADGLFDEFPRIEALRVTVKKPDAPMRAVFDFVGIVITEKRPGNR